MTLIEQLKQVAVAPYWNVNVIKFGRIMRINRVAVAPYWNVNDKGGSIEMMQRLSSSSSILECKYIS